MVSTCPQISKISNPFINLLGIIPNAPIVIGMTVTFIFHFFFFFVIKLSLDIYHSFRFLLILLCGLLGRQSPLIGKFSFFLDYLSVSSLLLLLVVVVIVVVKGIVTNFGIK